MKTQIMFSSLICSTLILSASLSQAFLAKSSSSSRDKSGFTMEPATSYTTGVLKQSGINDIGTQSFGFDIGLGYRISNYSFGVTYGQGSGTADQSGVKQDYKALDTGLYATANVPFMFKLSGGYLLSSSTKVNSTLNTSDFAGSGFRFGVVYDGLPYVTLKLEQIQRSYTKYNGASLTNPLKDTTTLLSVGLPLFN